MYSQYVPAILTILFCEQNLVKNTSILKLTKVKIEFFKEYKHFIL